MSAQAHIMRDAWNRYREMLRWSGMRFDREKFRTALQLAWSAHRVVSSPEYKAEQAARPSVLPAIDRMEF